MYSNEEIQGLKAEALRLLSTVPGTLKEYNHSLIAALSDDGSDADIEQFIASVDYLGIKQTPEFIEAKRILVRIMELVATELASNWDDPRYSRELSEE